MLQLFRNNQLTTIPLVFLYFLIFYVGGYIQQAPISPAEISAGWTAFAQFFVRLSGSSLLGLQIVWGVLILLQAFLLNFIVNHYKLSKRYSFISTIALILVYNIVGSDLKALPISLSNTFLLLALYNLFACYDKRPTYGAVFNMGFWLSVAALSNWAASVYILVFVLGLLILRAFDTREMLLLFIGIGMPLFWMLTYQYLNDNAANWLQIEVLAQYGLPTFAKQSNIFVMLSLLIWAIILLWGLSNIGTLQQKTTLQEQSYISLIYIMLLNTALFMLLTPNIEPYHLLTAAVPISILLSLSFQAISANTRAELAHWLLFMIAIAIQYQFLFK